MNEMNKTNQIIKKKSINELIQDKLYPNVTLNDHPFNTFGEQLEPGYCEGYMYTEILSEFSFFDRIRIFISGKFIVKVKTRTDVMVGKAQSIGSVRVLPPYFNIDKPIL